jgi:4-hydroxybenzoate polyprenyltransferase
MAIVNPPLQSRPAPIEAARPLLRTLALAALETRLSVQFAFLQRFLAAATLAGALHPAHLLRTLATALVWQAAVGVVYLLNGLSDLVEDRVNGTGRPLASGRLDEVTALRICVATALAAMAGAWALGGPLVVMVVAMLGLGYLYSAPPFALKRYPLRASVVIVAGGLLTYAAGAAAAGHALLPPAVVVLGLAMSAWMAVVGATTKDLPDVAGDARAGRRSLAVALGPVRAGLVAAAGALTVAAAFAACAVARVPRLLPGAVVALIGALVLTGRVVRWSVSGTRAGRRRPYRVFMITQQLVHAVVLVTITV